MCKWIPIKHSFVCGVDAIVSDLPKDGEIVFITIRGGKVGYDVFERVPNDRWKFKHFDIKDVEAWMRFPKPHDPNDWTSLWKSIEHDPEDEQHPTHCIILPEDGEQVLITVRGGYVLIDTFEIYDSGNVDFHRIPIECVTAWMKFPTPYVPRRCRDCRYGMTTYDDDGFRWTRCELDGVGVISNYKPKDCPLKKEVNHGSN